MSKPGDKRRCRDMYHLSAGKRGILAIILTGTLGWRMKTFSNAPILNTHYYNASVVDKNFQNDAIVQNDKDAQNDLGQTKIFGDEDLSIFSDETSSKKCAPREGVIVSNTMGRLANNLFEIGFANRLAAELCWPLLYRPFWQGEVPNPRATECFPHANLPTDHTVLTISQSLQEKVRLNATFWSRLGTVKFNRPYMGWLAKLEEEGVAMKVANDKRFFTGNGPDMIVEQIRNETSQVRVLGLEAFFIHSDWMRDWKHKIQRWFTMNEACCHHQPPDDAVVIHVRDFGPRDETNQGFKPSIYTHIMEHYNLTDRPLWIVCQPDTADSQFVKDIIAASPKKNATIATGSDQYDAFCTITRAKTLLLTSASTFSQMAAYLADPTAEVHYPLKTMRWPKTTLEVPGWKYHRVDAQLLDRIDEFDVPRERITFKHA